MPFIFVLAPEILLTNVTSWFVTIQAMISAIVGVFLLSCATENYMMAPLRWYERLIALAGALGLLYPGTVSDLAGLAVLIGLWLLTKKRAEKAK